VPEGRGVSLDPQHGRLDDRRTWLVGVSLASRAEPDVDGQHCKLLPHRARFGFARRGIADAGVSEPPAAFWLALTIHAHPTMSEAFHESVLAALGHPLHI
jgi:hypothetical protein